MIEIRNGEPIFITSTGCTYQLHNYQDWDSNPQRALRDYLENVEDVENERDFYEEKYYECVNEV